MKKITKDTWASFVVLLAVFWLFPLATWAYNHWVDPYAKWIIAVLIVGFPVITLAFSLADGVRHGFNWLWAVVPLVSFLTTLFVFYNGTAIIYSPAYAVIGLLGTAIGSYFHRILRTDSRTETHARSN